MGGLLQNHSTFIPMGLRHPRFAIWVLALIAPLVFPVATWAEVCPGSQVPRSELDQFDAALPLSLNAKLQAEDTHLPWGFPGRSQLLYHSEFVVSYDSERRVPIWVAHRLRAEDVLSRPRRDSFRTDPRLRPDRSATCADYEEPVFDRGHLVPRADMNRSAEAQAYTYFLSNMAPQHDFFNRRIWNHLEGLVRDWATARGTIYVITGSVFDRDDDGRPDGLGGTKWLMPGRRVGVPSHFYKILIHRTATGDLETLALLLPHLDMDPPDRDAYLLDHLVTIDEIESRTGLDFLPGLGPLREDLVERAVAPDLWPRE